MTNRRKGTRGRTAAAKKSESPEKQTRRLNRRSKRSRKSESPEPEPEECSDNSAVEDNAEDSERRDEDRDDNDNQKGEDSDNGMYSRNSDEPKSQLKEEESAGSDGSWKVKSENGGGGGIPKLKLCLTRPPEMSSPTSESSPSPRRRGRKPKGIASPAKDDSVEEPVVEEKESPKRSTRSSRAKAVVEPEPTPVVVERTEPTPPPEEPPCEVSEVTPLREVTPPKEEIEEQIPLPQEVPTTYQEDCDSTNINHDEAEDETRLAVESISIIQPPEDTQVNLTQRLRERISRREEPPAEEEPVSSNKEKDVGKEAEAQKVEEEAEPPQAEKESVTEAEPEPEPVREEKPERIQETEPEPEPVKEEQPTVVEEPERKEEPIEEDKEREQEQVVEGRRSSSRDSSEERAKQEALMSRKRNKKVEEPVEPARSRSSQLSPKNENFSRSEEEAKPTSTTPATNDNEHKEITEEHTPVVRKRRWGSSSSRVAKKPTVSISTDFLKEIIPEVKPLPMSEVHLSPNEDEEEGQLKDSEDSVPAVTKKSERDKIMQSEESEKDYEEENVESGAEETQTESVKPAPVKEKEYSTFTRKVSVVSSNDLNTLQKSPSPPRNKPSNILYIVNLVRPFTIPQLRELLARTGTIVEDGFWIDKIKSRCYVKYETEEQAKATRHALHGVQWPVSNPKTLNVDYGTESAMKAAQEGNETAGKRPIPSLFDKQIDVKANEKAKEREKEREERSRDKREKLEQDRKERLKHREDERKDDEEKEKKRPIVEPLTRDRTVRRVTVPVREWDVGKNEDGFSPPPDGMDYGRHRDDRYERRVEYDRDKRDDYDDRRRRDRDRGRRSLSGEPPRKAKKKSEDEAPAKLLDDLFRKTKATPCIYWLPLTAEQIAVKEEMRRKHMADHEKKIAELRKIQREQSKRGSDKRRRRTRSRSRSRSPKK